MELSRLLEKGNFIQLPVCEGPVLSSSWALPSPAAGNILVLTNGSTKFPAKHNLDFNLLHTLEVEMFLKPYPSQKKLTRSSCVVIEGVSLNPWASRSCTMVLLVMKRERKGIGVWSLWRHKSPRTHQSSAFSKPENCLWPLTSPALGIEGRYWIWCSTGNMFHLSNPRLGAQLWFFFSNEKNNPIHFRYEKLLIPELWNEMLQDTWHMSCHLGALARALQPRTCSKIQHLWKWTLSSFSFILIPHACFAPH